MIDALRNDFKSHLKYDYDVQFSCPEAGCYIEGICRCGYITNTSLTRVDVSKISLKIYSEIFDKSLSTKRHNAINSLFDISEEIEKYTIDRILRINKIWKPEFWQINVCHGYYGQEIDDIVIDEDIVQTINKQLEKAFEIDNLSQRIEYLLELENGFLLDNLKSKKYSIDYINRNDIIFSNPEHHSKVLLDELDHYSDKNYTGIRGIVKKDGDKCRVIDGYHRLSRTENSNIKVLVCV
jgi:hypothetical protein